MAFSPEIASIIKEMGYEWTITDAPLYDAVNQGTSIPYKQIGRVNGLPVFFRSNEWSNEFSQVRPNSGDYDVAKYVTDLRNNIDFEWFKAHKGYVVLAYDGETIGHHVKRYDSGALSAYAYMSRQKGFEPILFSQLLGKFPFVDVGIKPGSWSTSVEDIREGECFPLWSHSKNPIHSVFNELTGITIEAVHTACESINGNDQARIFYEEARTSLDYGHNSCKQFWSNPAHEKWEPKHIYTGFNQLAESVHCASAAIRLSNPNANFDFDKKIPDIGQRLHEAVRLSTPKK